MAYLLRSTSHSKSDGPIQGALDSCHHSILTSSQTQNLGPTQTRLSRIRQELPWPQRTAAPSYLVRFSSASVRSQDAYPRSAKFPRRQTARQFPLLKPSPSYIQLSGLGAWQRYGSSLPFLLRAMRLAGHIGRPAWRRREARDFTQCLRERHTGSELSQPYSTISTRPEADTLETFAVSGCYP